ncbi:MAG: DUF4258 domain-containing protein [bacterium]
MDDFLDTVRDLINQDQVRISEHGYDELAGDDLKVDEVIGGINDAVVVEKYPEYSKGPCVLVLQEDENDNPVHVV